MNSHLYVFFGAPGSGKSEVLKYLSTETDASITIIRKETTRKRRKTDSIEVKTVESLSPRCDIRYSQYGTEYGFSSRDIWRIFSKGNSAAVIVNDIRTIKSLKRTFGVLSKVIYIHSNIDHEGMVRLAQQRGVISGKIDDDTAKRIRKIQTIHQKYIENTSIFDYTILNVGTFQNLHTQLQNILRGKSLENRGRKSNVRIFIITGASYSGKDELLKALQQMEPQNVISYRKYTDRPARKNDNNKLRHVTSEEIKKHNAIYVRQGFEYAINFEDLWLELGKGKIVLLVVSDRDCIEELIKEYGAVCTVLFLHANFDTEEIRTKMVKDNLDKLEIQDRINGIKELFSLYVTCTAMFDHVLLNTAEPEDLYDQAFNILGW